MGVRNISPYSLHPRDCDYDRYLCSLFMGRKHRPALWWAIAFAHEIMHIPARVSEEMVGLVRLTWWREALEKEEAYRASAPLLQALASLSPQNPALTQHAIALCDIVAEYGFAGQEQEAIIALMQGYFRLLSAAAMEQSAQHHYDGLARIVANIAYLRTRHTLPAIEKQRLTQKISEEWLEYGAHKPTMPYIRHLWLLTRREVQHVQINDTPPPLFMAAGRLWWDSFTFSLRNSC